MQYVMAKEDSASTSFVDYMNLRVLAVKKSL